MKVVYIADIGIEGGATRSLFELVSTMKERYGVEPVVLTSKPSRFNELLEEKQIENHSVGHGAFLQGAPDARWKTPAKYILYGLYYYTHLRPSLKAALKAIDWETVDLIHTNVARDDIGMMLSRRTGTPNICHIREFGEADFYCWSYRWHYVRYLAKRTDGFIAISNAVKDCWVQKGLDARQIRVIYNGVDGDSILPADHMGWAKDDILRLVIVGGVIPNKGQWQAIESLTLLSEAIRGKVQLDVIGRVTGTYKTNLLKPLHALHIENSVRFLGGCDDVYERLKDYHIGLMCSKAEGFGRVTVEYMHAGLAVIASDSGANREIIEDGRTGLLYRSGNTQALANAVARLYQNRELLCQTAEAGREAAKRNFTKERNAQNIYTAYSEICKAGKT